MASVLRSAAVKKVVPILSKRVERMMFRAVFWVVLPCKMIVDRRFRGAYCLHHQGWVIWTSYSPPWELEISHSRTTSSRFSLLLCGTSWTSHICMYWFNRNVSIVNTDWPSSMKNGMSIEGHKVTYWESCLSIDHISSPTGFSYFENKFWFMTFLNAEF